MIPAHVLAALLASSDVTFFVLFGVFVAALVVLCVIVLRWAIRRDSAGRAAWRARQLQRQQTAGDAEPPATPPT
jgi:hypothetical protein